MPPMDPPHAYNTKFVTRPNVYRNSESGAQRCDDTEVRCRNVNDLTLSNLPINSECLNLDFFRNVDRNVDPVLTGSHND